MAVVGVLQKCTILFGIVIYNSHPDRDCFGPVPTTTTSIRPNMAGTEMAIQDEKTVPEMTTEPEIWEEFDEPHPLIMEVETTTKVGHIYGANDWLID